MTTGSSEAGQRNPASEFGKSAARKRRPGERGPLDPRSFWAFLRRHRAEHADTKSSNPYGSHAGSGRVNNLYDI